MQLDSQLADKPKFNAAKITKQYEIDNSNYLTICKFWGYNKKVVVRATTTFVIRVNFVDRANLPCAISMAKPLPFQRRFW